MKQYTCSSFFIFHFNFAHMIAYYADLLGVLVFAISGALAASGKNMYKDLFGLSFTGFATAVGGGTLRDMILGAYPVAWVKDNNYLLAIFAGIIIAVLFRQQFARMQKVFLLFDSIGIAIYTIVGLQKALALQVAPLAAMLMGLFTAVMGGVIRDTLTNEIPQIFRKQIYATACIAGALLYLLLHLLKVDDTLNSLISITLIFLLRILSVKYKWSLPRIDLP
jgi:uncharacterized membrane protein YeiH